MSQGGLDDPSRGAWLKQRIRSKAGLSDWYDQVYERYARALSLAAPGGLAVELGAGGGFCKEALPQVLTTDTLPYEGVDQVVDALAMPFADGQLSAILMLNVLHHLPDAEAFFREAQRCLRPGGKLLIIDEHPGWLGGPVLRYAHHEPYDPQAPGWSFASTGPLSGANGAMAWMVFCRDRERFEQLYPGLRLEGYRPFAPLQYWLSGGLKAWSLLPKPLLPTVRWLDRLLLALSPQWGCFVEVELTRVEVPA